MRKDGFAETIDITALMKAYSITFICIFISLFTEAQKAKYAWSYGLCYFSGEYDSTIITRKQLDDTWLLCSTSYWISFRAREFAWSPGQLDSLSIRKYRQEYKAKLKQLNNLILVKDSFWEEQRRYTIQLLDERYKFGRIMIHASKKPSTLKKYELSDTCAAFIDVIIFGGDSLLNVWRKFRKQECQNSGDPQWCFEEYFQKRYDSPDRLIWAKLDLMTFGFQNNCAKYFLKTSISFGKAQEEFRKLFQNEAHGCED